jgi:hypothetical protein
MRIKNRMNSSALSDMNEKEGMYYLHKWKVQMRSCFTKKNLKEPGATRSKDYKT